MMDNSRLFLNIVNNKRVVVFGAGQNGKEFIDKYKSIVNIAYIVDNNAEVWGQEVCGVTVKSPLQLKEDLDHNSDIFVLIAVGRYFEICLQLLLQMRLKTKLAYIDGEFVELPDTAEKLEPRSFRNILLRIETTNRCNFNCSFCTHSQLTRQTGDMDDGLYSKIITEAAELGFRKLDLRNFGEPLLDPKLDERIMIAKENGFTNVFIYTNALLLNKKRYQSLSDSGLNKLIISLSPKREFELTRKGMSYERIFNNIIDAAEEFKYRESKDLCHAMIEVHIVAPDSTDDECRETEIALRGIGIEKIVRTHIHNWSNSNGDVTPQYRNPCRRLFDSVTILQDGKVALCCIDYDGEYILGDLNENSLSEVINSDKYCAMRKAQIQGKYPPICLNCTNFR